MAHGVIVEFLRKTAYTCIYTLRYTMTKRFKISCHNNHNNTCTHTVTKREWVVRAVFTMIPGPEKYECISLLLAQSLDLGDRNFFFP